LYSAVEVEQQAGCFRVLGIGAIGQVEGVYNRLQLESLT
jgi:hypothetical protein